MQVILSVYIAHGAWNTVSLNLKRVTVINSQGKKNPATNCQSVESFLSQVRSAREMRIDR